MHNILNLKTLLIETRNLIKIRIIIFVEPLVDLAITIYFHVLLG